MQSGRAGAKTAGARRISLEPPSLGADWTGPPWALGPAFSPQPSAWILYLVLCGSMLYMVYVQGLAFCRVRLSESERVSG